jgi:hypothetical protein
VRPEALGPIRLLLRCPFCHGATLALVTPRGSRTADPATVRCRAACPGCRARAVAVEAWVAANGLDQAIFDPTPEAPRRWRGRTALALLLATLLLLLAAATALRSR